jgi:hypothetical protein
MYELSRLEKAKLERLLGWEAAMFSTSRTILIFKPHREHRPLLGELDRRARARAGGTAPSS